MAIYQVWFFFTVLLLPEYGGGAFQEDNCKVMRCNKHHGPDIRFPFWLKGLQPRHCGYPGFDLSCTQNKHTMLDLPFPFKSPTSTNQTNPPNSVKLQVKKIDYKSQSILISEINGCLSRFIRDQKFAASPFQFMDTVDITVFSCAETIAIQSNYYLQHIPCLSSPGNQVYAVRSRYPLYMVPAASSCRRMYNISSAPYYLVRDFFPIELNWSQPECGLCEAKGKFCRLKNESLTYEETECFPRPLTRGLIMKNLKIAGTVIGMFLAAVFLYWLITSLKAKKEDQLKIEKFLEDYEALKPTRYSYADIKKITNNFSERVGQGGHGTVYKGNLSDHINVAVKVLENSTGNGEHFVNEVSTIGLIHHVNIVRLVGYCADGFKRALVYEFMPNDSLAKFVQSPHRIKSLGWDKLRHISLCIAKGIEYLHQGCDQRILHFDIKPQNILLDCNFNPKIYDFGLAKLCSKEQSAVSMTATRGTMGYIAPEVFSRNFGNVSYKSDVYSFGMLLLEIVGATTKKEKKCNDDVYFPEWIYKKLEEEDNLGLGIEEVGDGKIARRLTIVGLRCIQWYPVNRPSMKVVIQMLFGEDDNLSVPQNPFASLNNNDGATTTRERAYTGELEVISESELWE